MFVTQYRTLIHSPELRNTNISITEDRRKKKKKAH